MLGWKKHNLESRLPGEDRAETIQQTGEEVRADTSKKGDAAHVKCYEETQLGSWAVFMRLDSLQVISGKGR